MKTIKTLTLAFVMILLSLTTYSQMVEYTTLAQSSYNKTYPMNWQWFVTQAKSDSITLNYIQFRFVDQKYAALGKYESIVFLEQSTLQLFIDKVKELQDPNIKDKTIKLNDDITIYKMGIGIYIINKYGYYTSTTNMKRLDAFLIGISEQIEYLQ